METYDIVKIVFGIIASVGSAGGIVWFFVKLSANTLADQYKEEIKHDFDKQFEAYKTQLDVLKETTLKYNDKQFELYLDLWKNLQELKFASMDLWKEGSKSNFRKFRTALSKSDRQIETFSILIEINHYQELSEIIGTFKEYEIGKKRFIETRNNVPEDKIQEMLNFNREIKDRFLEIIETIKSDIQSKIKGDKE